MSEVMLSGAVTEQEEQCPHTPVLITPVVAETEEMFAARSPRLRSLGQHPAFGCWRERHIDALHYQETLRAEWEACS